MEKKPLAWVGYKDMKLGYNVHRAILIKSLEPCKAQTLDFIVWLRKPTDNEKAALMQQVPKDKAKFPWVVKGY